MAKFNPPDSFNFSNPTEWADWKQRFSRYRSATKLKDEDEEVQISSLIYAMGNEAEHVFQSFQFENNDDSKKYDVVLQKFNEYFIQKKTLIHERAKFNLRSQGTGEPVEAFIRSLYEMSEKCEFTDKQDRIRDRLAVGLSDNTLSERLQLMDDLTLDKAVQIARQSEMVKSQIQDLNPRNVEEVKSFRQNKNRHTQFQKSKPNANQNYQRGSNHQSQSCTRCNKKHNKNAKCPAMGKRCRLCNKPNHFEVCCRTKAVQEVVHSRNDTSYVDDDRFFLGSITSCDDDVKAWNITLSIFKLDIAFKIDTGADISIISQATYNKFQKKPKLETSSAQLYSPGGALNCMGHFTAHTVYKGRIYTFKVYVIQGKSANNLLGRGVACRMKLIRRVDRVSTEIFGNGGLIQCDPVKIKLKSDATPYCVTTARRVPFPILPNVQQELEKMEKLGVIRPVTEPTEWCAPMVPVRKKNGNVRICVDLSKLNAAVRREHFMLPNLDDIAPKLAGAKYFSKLDASSGFYQIPLSPESSILTTFITPFGRFCFQRIPFGITSAPEIFQRKMTEMLNGLDGVDVIMDDMIIYGKTLEEHDKHLNETLNRIHNAGMKLNKDKCEFQKTSLEYFGHIISSDVIRPNPARVKAISELDMPTNVKELQRIIGMVNYLGKFVPDLSSIMRPMTELLSSKTVWQWGPQQVASFDKVKELLTRAPVLAYYDVTKPTVVSADASSYGLGGAIFQQHGDKLYPVAFCSRTLTSAETKYAQIEKECLASVWSCEKFARYLVGLESFKLLTDHKPLVPLINSQDIDKTPLRCQRLLMRLRRFSAKAEYIAGKELVVPDTLSRSPLKDTESNDIENDIEAYVNSIESDRPMSDSKIEQIRQLTIEDNQLQCVIKLTKSGWLDQEKAVPPDASEYFAARNSLSVHNGLLLYENRIVVPMNLRRETLENIHEGHQGITKCRERARTCVWWPGLNKEIQQKIEMCNFCQETKPSQRREPLKPTPLPARPWQKVSADLFELNNKQYIVVMDYYSRYIELAYLPKITSNEVIYKLKNIFARWGIAEELVSDNGRQFTSQAFRSFSEKYGFKQTLTSPYFPQANGAAESAVKIAKRILRQDDIFAALLAYRATPNTATGVSPAQLIMGRQIRTSVPVLPQNLKPKWPNLKEVRQRDEKAKMNNRDNYDKHHAAKNLPELKIGDKVRIKLDNEKLWSVPGKVIKAFPETRSYKVQTAKGIYIRNRRHLQLVKSMPTCAHHDVAIRPPQPLGS